MDEGKGNKTDTKNVNETSKKISLNDLEENDGKSGKNFWILIGDKVYDVSNFKHPGGKSIFKEPGPGADLQEGFDDAGHSKSAIEKMNGMFIGTYSK